MEKISLIFHTNYMYYYQLKPTGISFYSAPNNNIYAEV